MRNNQKGQALLIVVLVMVVALTVGLSLASRSITNLRNTTDEANSQKAFAAAEAGVEQVLKTGNAITSSIDLGNNSQISKVSSTIISGSGTNGIDYLLNNGNPVFQDDGVDVWLSPHDETPLFHTPWNGGTLSLYWGTNSNPCAEPAIEVILISSSSNSAPQLHATLSRYAIDSCDSRRTNQPNPNNFSKPQFTGSFTVTGADGTVQIFNYREDFTTISNGLLLRVIPLYTSGIFGIRAANLPPQGKLITSTGVSGGDNAQTVRKVTFFQGYESLPSELLYALFSPR